MNKQSGSADLTVYYNSACPICKAGIEMQKRKQSACDILWNDVHIDNNAARCLGKELPVVRKYLHAVDAQGETQIGINAFILLWENSAHEQWKAKLFSLPLVREAAQGGYFIFANLLYGWNLAMKNW